MMLDNELLSAFFKDIVVPENSVILDVGCQNAAALEWIKQKYHIKGKMFGIDKQDKNFGDSNAQEESKIYLKKMNASEPLEFPDETFDLIFHCNTLECMTDINNHIVDLHRVLKRNGRIVCVHIDWESIVFNGCNKKLINKAVYNYANFQQGWMDDCDGWIGRRLWGHFNKTGLFEGEISIYNSIETDFTETNYGWKFMHDLKYFFEPKGFLTETEYEELLEDLKAAFARGEYLFMLPYYIYSGVKK